MVAAFVSLARELFCLSPALASPFGFRRVEGGSEVAGVAENLSFHYFVLV